MESLYRDPETYSMEAFAAAHQMSRSRLYEILNMGCGPKVTRNGRCRLITREAAEQWRREWTGRDLPSRPKRPEAI